MKRKIFFFPEKCMSCLSCLLACQMQSVGCFDIHDAPWQKRPLARLRLTLSRGTPWLWRCQHCQAAPCVETCVSGSLRQLPDEQRVVQDRDACVKCGSCIAACPFGGVFMDDEVDSVYKCDLCPDEDIPPCVRSCPSGALVYADSESYTRIRRTGFARRLNFHVQAS